MTALVIPLAVAVVSAIANYLVVLIHALDGSDEVARLDKLAAATRRASARRTSCGGGPHSRLAGEPRRGGQAGLCLGLARDGGRPVTRAVEVKRDIMTQSEWH